jgi:hypothetical protein
MIPMEVFCHILEVWCARFLGVWFWEIPGLVNIEKTIENGHRNSGFTN